MSRTVLPPALLALVFLLFGTTQARPAASVVPAAPAAIIFGDSGQELGNFLGSDVAIGDFDGDGDLDALVANYDAPNQIWVNEGGAQGGAEGVFTFDDQNLGASAAVAVAAADLDGDGDLDAFVARDGSNGNAYDVYINQGGAQGGVAGIFQKTDQTFGDDLASGIALGDVDGDADVDAFIARNVGRADRVWLNDGAGLFGDSGQTLGSDSSNAVALGDVDGDGDLDAFTGNGDGSHRVWVNQGGAQGGTEGVFADSGQVLGDNSGRDVALGDLDGDGDLDAFVANVGGAQVWANQGGAQGGTEGLFSTAGPALGSAHGREVALADFDGDGDLDAFVATFSADEVWVNQGGAEGGTAGAFLHNGQELGQDLSEGAAVGDVDGDGDLDVFVAAWDDPDRIWLNLAGLAQDGEGWQHQVVDARGDAGLFTDVVLDAAGHPHIAYVSRIYVQSGNDYRLHYAHWDGVRWRVEFVDQQPLIADDPFAGGAVSLALDTQGNPHVAYAAGADILLLELTYARKDDAGQWFKETVPGTEVSGGVSLALDGSDNPHVSYRDIGLSEGLFYARRDNAGWHTQVVDDSVGVGAASSLALDSAGNPHISYLDDYEDLLRYAARDGSGWQIQQLPEPAETLSGHTDLALDDDDRAHIGYLTEFAREINVVSWGGQGWQTRTAVETLLGDRIGQTFAMGLDGNAAPHISYRYQVFNGGSSLGYAYWDGSAWRRATLDQSSSDVGHHSALALDAAGAPHVTYYEGQYGDLRYVSMGPDWQVRTVDGTGQTVAPDVAVKDAAPFFSYYNAGRGQVRMATWDGAWQHNPLAFIASEVPATAIVGGANYPQLTYYDPTNDRLMYARWHRGAWDPLVVDDAGDPGRYHDLVHLGNADQGAKVAYWDAAGLAIRLAQVNSAFTATVTSTNTAAPALNAASGFLSAANMAGGDVGISYYDGLAGDLRLAVWDAASGNWSDQRVDGASANVGRLNALAVDGSSGAAAVAYYDDTAGLIRYAYQSGSGWQIEPVVSVPGGPDALDLGLGVRSLLHPRVAYSAGGATYLAIKRGDAWTVETVPAPAGAEGLSLALDNRPHLAIGGAGADGDLLYAFRSASLDIDPDAPPGPPGPGSVGAYNPLDACAAILQLFFPDDSLPSSAPLAATAVGDLGDEAVFSGMSQLFSATAEGQRYVELYMQHGPEMGRLGLQDPQLLWDAAGTLQNFMPGLQALVTGRGEEVLVTQQMVDDALSVWQRLAAGGSTDLASIINAELAASDDLQDFVGMSFDEWARTIGVHTERLYMPVIAR